MGDRTEFDGFEPYSPHNTEKFLLAPSHFMTFPSFAPPLFLRDGLAMTLYAALKTGKSWDKQTVDPVPNYQEHVFAGAGETPIFAWVAVPPRPRGTWVATYGITGTLDNQWFLQVLGRKAFAQNYAVVLFDWRAHGKTAALSPTLTSDGLYEGEDFVCIAEQAKELGCPAPFWLAGYSLGGQLALWGVKTAQTIDPRQHPHIAPEEIVGAAVICPSLESQRSLSYLVSNPLGKRLEQRIAQELKKLAWSIHDAHPGAMDGAAIERANSIWDFDRELVIAELGFPTVEEYYAATSPLYILPQLKKPTLIVYAEDDPMFDPTLVPDLLVACDRNPALTPLVTRFGGHVGYISSSKCQWESRDADPWWAWNRVLEWVETVGGPPTDSISTTSAYSLTPL